MANPKEPPGGFQQGGWYEGRQYWNGTFSQPGQINVQSNQQGAGQAVSQEVVQQTNPANWSYIQNQQAQAPSAPAQSGQPSNQAGASTGAFSNQQETLNLPELYKSLTESSGIAQIQAELSNKERAYNDAVSKINDNPFLSEASRVGRIQKLSTDYQNSIANLQNDVATKQADVEMQLNLQTKQFDINSQVAQQSLEQFNTLLSMGALDNASGEDIANITRSTGLSSSAIYSAINAKKTSDVQTQTISYDDGENQGFAIINSQTGEIINKQKVANSDSGEGADKLTSTQERQVVASASKALKEAQGGGTSKWVDLKEYKKAIQLVIEATGIDKNTADNYLTQQMQTLGYKKYKW